MPFKIKKDDRGLGLLHILRGWPLSVSSTLPACGSTRRRSWTAPWCCQPKGGCWLRAGLHMGDAFQRGRLFQCLISAEQGSAAAHRFVQAILRAVMITSSPVRAFLSAAPEDTELRDQLQRHLYSL